MLRDLARWYRTRPLWVRALLALPALVVGLALLAAGVARFARPGAPQRRVVEAARDLGRAEGEAGALAGDLHRQAERRRVGLTEAQARDAAADAERAARIEAATKAVPEAPPPGWRRAPDPYEDEP